MQKKKKIVAIGLPGFPYGTAPIHKLKMMGKAFVEAGDEFFVISNKYVKKTKLNHSLQEKGVIDEISYLTTSPKVFAPQSIIEKIQSLLLGKIREFLFLTNIKRRKGIDAVIIYSSNFVYTVFYAILLRFFNIPVYLIYFELRSALGTDRNLLNKLNNFLFDRFSFSFVNGVFTISNLLVNQIQRYSPITPHFIIPPIVDFKLFSVEHRYVKGNYFLYCGSLAYYDVISFIVKSFFILNNSLFELKLVIGGSKDKLKELNKLVADYKLQSKVQIYSNIPDDELKDLYLSAKALLIPLRNTQQDIARFPHKIAEYCAARCTIVTTKVGDITRYFNDKSALISEKYDEQLFAEKLKFVIDNPDVCEKMADRSYEVGNKWFNYKSYSLPMHKFLFRNY